MIVIRHVVFFWLIPVLFLAGCTTSFLGGSVSSKKFNLTDSSYAAADMLVQQSKALVTPDTSLQIGVLADTNKPGELTAFGKMVAGQIGARFVQLGYNVTSSSFDEIMMRREQQQGGMLPPGSMGQYGGGQYNGGYGSAGPANQATISGQYAVAKKEVLVNLRVMEPGSGRMIAAYDYSIPYTRDVKELTRSPSDKGGWLRLR